MRKKDEITFPGSCLNRASDDEMIFVLRQHDITSPATIRFWVMERIRTGKNSPQDDQIISALVTAATMEREQ